MYNARTALLNHLRSAEFEPEQTITIQAYAGELTDRERAARIRIPLPAILVLFMEGSPIKQVPEHLFSLLFVTETRKAEASDAETDALLLAQLYAAWLENKPQFSGTAQDKSLYHLVNLASSRAHTLLNDHKYTIIELPVEVRRIA